jgi:hypothetical protein
MCSPAAALGTHLVPNTTVLLCTACISGLNNPFDPPSTQESAFAGQVEVHIDHIAIFKDILLDTGNPALALQAHFTLLFGTAYYDHVMEFNLASPAVLVKSVEVLKPTGRRFFAAVVAVCLVHWAIVGLVCCLFAGRGWCLEVGGNWQVFALLGSEDVDVLLRKAGGAGDEVVRRRIVDMGMGGQRVDVGSVGKRVMMLRKEG